MRLRYRLIPYLYAAFVRAAETGEPVQRPLVFDHQDDPTGATSTTSTCSAATCSSRRSQPGETTRQVYLPAGDWYDWHTGEPARAPRYLTRRRRWTASRSSPAAAR